jgi:lipopolysaccharide/colanic/teichoic acid biosynthesis glycosyltransferase
VADACTLAIALTLELAMSGTSLGAALGEPTSLVATHETGAGAHVSDRDDPLPTSGRVIKRTFDIVASLLLLTLALPLLVAAMIATWLETPGSPIFQQTRIGRHGHPFRIFKLRTMISGNTDEAHRSYVASLIGGHAEQHGGIYKLAGDPRVTRVGRVMRRFSIDEVPQMWNVLRGDMSLVGPRPALPFEVDLYSAYDRRRLRVKPGVTGLWQIAGRTTTSFSEMVDLDIAYQESWTLALELTILVRTPWVVLTGVGAA